MPSTSPDGIPAPDHPAGGGAPGAKTALHRKPSDQVTMEDLLFEMQSRPGGSGPGGANINNNTHVRVPGSSNGVLPPGGTAGGESGVFSGGESSSSVDVYAQLEQKERDLVLAAELGKALLDKNEELSRQNERIAEEFSVKLEVGTTIHFILSFVALFTA